MNQNKKHIHILITGGTIDSIFDATKDMIVVNDSSTICHYLQEMIQPHFVLSQEVITMRDSRQITENIRDELLSAIKRCEHDYILITHGTYTMALTASYLSEHLSNSDKRIVLTGSMYPLQGFAPTDAPFNLGFAIGSLLLAEPGVYLAMNGKLFQAGEVEKNISAGRFEAT